MPLDRASIIGCAVITGTGAVFNSAKVEPGTDVAVNGAALAGAGRIIAIDRLESKLELAIKVGATHTIL